MIKIISRPCNLVPLRRMEDKAKWTVLIPKPNQTVQGYLIAPASTPDKSIGMRPLTVMVLAICLYKTNQYHKARWKLFDEHFKNSYINPAVLLAFLPKGPEHRRQGMADTVVGKKILNIEKKNSIHSCAHTS